MCSHPFCFTTRLISGENVFFRFLPVAASVNMSLCNALSRLLKGWGFCWWLLGECFIFSVFYSPLDQLVTAKSLVLWQPNPRGVKQQIWICTFILLPQLCVMTLMKSKHPWSITFGQRQCSSCMFFQPTFNWIWSLYMPMLVCRDLYPNSFTLK